MIQKTLSMECKARGQDEVFAHTTINREVQTCSTMKLNTLRMEYQARGQDKVPTSHYCEPVMEAVRFNPSISLPLEILKERFFIQKTCEISSLIALHFINVLHLLIIENSVRLIGRIFFSIDQKIEDIHHKVIA